MQCKHPDCSVQLPDCSDETGNIDAEACLAHGCPAGIGWGWSCRQLLQDGSECCSEHQCAKPGCTKIRGGSFYYIIFCRDHGCGVEFCKNENQGIGTRCIKHDGKPDFYSGDDGW